MKGPFKIYAVQLLLLGALILIIRILFAGLPFAWGNSGVDEKLKYLQSAGEFPDVLFLGSSRFYRHIDPVFFDEYQEVQTNSFNLGFAGTFNPEAYYILDGILKDPQLRPKVIFMELQELREIDTKNINSLRSVYYLKWPYASLAIRSFLAKNEFNEAFKFLKNHVKYQLRIGQYRVAVKYRWLGNKPGRMYRVNKGYRSLERELRKKEPEYSVLERRKKFLEDPSEVGVREKKLSTAWDEMAPLTRSDRIHLKFIRKEIANAEKKGIHLIFVLPPQIPDMDLVSLWDALPEAHRIDLSNPDRYPEFYDLQYIYDLGHLNEEGACRFTTALAGQAAEIFESEGLFPPKELQ